jgi:hypothetical protein
MAVVGRRGVTPAICFERRGAADACNGRIGMERPFCVLRPLEQVAEDLGGMIPSLPSITEDFATQSPTRDTHRGRDKGPGDRIWRVHNGRSEPLGEQLA